jgi:peptidoglycan-N-acetylglucosamine deacetylase
MKKFHLITAALAGLAILILALPIPEAFCLLLLILMLTLYVFLLFYGASRINSQFFLPALCKGESGSKSVALTFDDGPHGDRSGEILELLQKHDCCASFFLTGSRAEAQPEIVGEMVKRGHLIGNHSYSHSNFFPLFRSSRIRKELENTQHILKDAGAGAVRFFRPPFGVSNPNVARGVKASGMEVAGWSIRSFDTRNEAAGKVVQRILRKMGGGDVILLHETSENILEILELLLPAIQKAGLGCVTLDQLFGKGSE